MPIYEYHCNRCNHSFDVLQRMNDAPPEYCPECYQGPVERLVSAAGFQLKGSGWYVTDFKDNTKKNANTPQSTGAASTSENAASSSAASDSKA